MATKAKQATIPLSLREEWDKVTKPFKEYYKRIEKEKNNGFR